MKSLTLALLSIVFTMTNMEACVTYNPNNNTYTVDPSGCVKTPREKPEKSCKSSKSSKDKKR